MFGVWINSVCKRDGGIITDQIVQGAVSVYKDNMVTIVIEYSVK